MPNNYFQFKQFTVYHDQCAMKVCTDACILGAWFAEKIPDKSLVLDIGAGSGLLTLMLAQKNNGHFHGIEIDLPSFGQLQQNIANSNRHNHILAFNGDACTYSFPTKYNFIITNPPFFEGDLKSPDAQKNLAMHSTALTLEKLTDVIDENLTPDGSFGILIPYHRTEAYISIARAKGFYLSEKLLVKQTPAHNYFRSILHFTRKKTDAVQTHELTIKDNNNTYTEAFTTLLKDYYLYL
ncbi:methyltransferase [Terrimonas sp.]|uniref:tRNA1(Val) (adenine(37)-N6)-methyltransferase n=1 Tax=Terrimonas sp. TaxID=1914338 RepID=UPI000D51502E|nr:methyltransferase [Terrimonas sp.]PVD52182.1 methyltransferase [Terrimonas sp.]